MGSFFQRVASVDPIAQALHLPGSGAYAKAQLDKANQTQGTGPYTGVAPTLAASQQGYVPGGTGANAGWKPFELPSQGGGFLQQAASMSGSVTPGMTSLTNMSGPSTGNWSNASLGKPSATGVTGASGPFSTTPTSPQTSWSNVNPYVTAAQNAGGASQSTGTMGSTTRGI